jgi:hypothetical protein
MRVTYVTGATVKDLGTTLPFVSNSSVNLLNPTASSVTLQFGDAATGPFSTGRVAGTGAPAVVPAGGALENVLVGGRYAAIENGVGQIQIVQV